MNHPLWTRGQESPCWTGEPQVIIHHRPYRTSSARRTPYIRIQVQYRNQARTKTRTQSPPVTEGDIETRTEDQGNVSNDSTSRDIHKRQSHEGTYCSRKMTTKVGEEKPPQGTRPRPRDSEEV